MDFDLEIISEEGDHQDPLFDSIMNAMNSMKEATADKIYQKIQKDGITNYSKPQVDRALASALKYGIFEVRNNRYRVRDDVLDDEDTVYWRLQKKRNQTPFRIDEASSDKQLGSKLNPEKDNQKFKKAGKVSHECPHCGRVKRPQTANRKGKNDKKGAKDSSKSKRHQKEKTKNKGKCSKNQNSSQKGQKKRKEQPDVQEERSPKRRRPDNRTKLEYDISPETSEERMFDSINNENNMFQEGSDTSSSEMDMISQYILKGQSEKNTKFPRGNNLRSSVSSENNTHNLRINDAKLDKRSSISIKSESDSEKTYMSSLSDDQSRSRSTDKFFDECPCTSRNASIKTRNQYLSGDQMYSHYERDDSEQRKENSDWLGCSDDPQGTIIQSNNVLTIEPMDSLALKSPEPASYIS